MRTKIFNSVAKIVIAVVFFALVLLCLAACGGGSENKPDFTQTSTTVTKYKTEKYFRYAEDVFFAVDEQGVGELGATSSAARLYRLRIGPLADIDTAQALCDKLLKFRNTSCSVVRMQ